MSKEVRTSVSGTVAKSQLPGIFDPVDLIKLRAMNEVVLLESADIVTKLGEKSMLLMDLALKIEAKSGQVLLTALSDEGEILLWSLKEELASWLVDAKKTSLTLRFTPLFNELDMLVKMHLPSKLEVLRAIFRAIKVKEENKETLMLGGVFAYDFLDHFEELPEARKDELDFPDYLFYLPLTAVVIEHEAKTCSLHSWSFHEHEPNKKAEARLMQLENQVSSAIKNYVDYHQAAPFISELDGKGFKTDIQDEDFRKLVEQCKAHINAGDVYQIVPSRTFSRSVKDPLACYQALRKLNPSPYMFYVKTKDWTLLGASPETFIKVDKGGRRVSVRPIAGTRRRGLDARGHIDEELDAREQVSLCLDEKELAEHMMLVDLARNDIASVAKTGSRRIKRLLGVDRFSHVMHLVSEVEGLLKDDYDALSAYQASMNMGTLMGAPKVRAAQLLRELERSKRGFYGGAVGYINQAGDMDTAIIIRSALVKNGTAYVRAGCGVVYDSNVEFETLETLNKAEAVLKALELADKS